MCRAAERSLAKTAAARTGPETRQCDEDLMREPQDEMTLVNDESPRTINIDVKRRHVI